MTGRKPTPEELRLWRESNALTKKKGPGEPGPEEELHSTPAIAEKKQSVIVANTPPRVASHEPLSALSGRDATKLFKTYGTPQATLDLHGMTKEQAHSRVQQFLLHSHALGMRHVMIITGKGRMGDGVLRAQLPRWLEDAKLRALVQSIAHPKPQQGGHGVLHIILKRRR